MLYSLSKCAIGLRWTRSYKSTRGVVGTREGPTCMAST